MLRWLCDRLVLEPSRDPIDAEDKTRRSIEFEYGRFEVWEGTTNGGHDGSADRESSDATHRPSLLVLKFPGTGGRAENATVHPAEAWPEHDAVVWTVNPPGYGGSPGRASLRKTAATARAAYRAMREGFGDLPMILTGNSLGNLAVLYLAARHHVDGLLMRNPPPLAELIRGEYPWWKTGFVSTMISTVVPVQLSAIQNAQRANARAVFLMSEHDRVVPPSYQQMIQSAYTGEKKVIMLEQSDHADPMPDELVNTYRNAIRWLL